MAGRIIVSERDETEIYAKEFRDPLRKEIIW